MTDLFPFRNMGVLFLLVIPAALLIWTWGRRGRGVVVPFDHSPSPRGRGIGVVVHMAESLPPVLLGIVILILAGPQRWAEPETKRVLTNIEMCVDVSGSMSAAFGSGTRYDASMSAINEFLDRREGDAFGLTFFGNSVLHWVPLTTDVSAFRCAPPFMRPGSLPPWFSGTEIGKALMACRKVLIEREEGDRMIVLISDGHSWDLGDGRDEEIARALADDNINVYAVHIEESAAPDSIVTITSITGGEVFNPGDSDGLRAVFQRIDEMQETQIEKASAEAVDHYLPWCQAAGGVLAAALLALFGLRSNPW
jgi:Ca-activated chloride channel family protein